MTTLSERKIAPVVTKTRFGVQKKDAAYWRSLSYQERIDALEQIREEYHSGEGNYQTRMQSVVTIIKRSKLKT